MYIQSIYICGNNNVIVVFVFSPGPSLDLLTPDRLSAIKVSRSGPFNLTKSKSPKWLPRGATSSQSDSPMACSLATLLTEIKKTTSGGGQSHACFQKGRDTHQLSIAEGCTLGELLKERALLETGVIQGSLQGKKRLDHPNNLSQTGSTVVEHLTPSDNVLPHLNKNVTKQKNHKYLRPQFGTFTQRKSHLVDGSDKEDEDVSFVQEGSVPGVHYQKESPHCLPKYTIGTVLRNKQQRKLDHCTEMKEFADDRIVTGQSSVIHAFMERNSKSVGEAVCDTADRQPENLSKITKENNFYPRYVRLHE